MTTPIDNIIYAICWWPSSDLSDHDLSAIVRAAATDTDSALLIAERMAAKRVEEGDEGDEALAVYGIEEARRSLAASPGRATRLEVRDKRQRAYSCGWVCIQPLRLQREVARPAPEDDGQELTITHFLYYSKASPEPSVAWAARSGSAILIGPGIESPGGSPYSHIHEALAALAPLIGGEWKGEVYAVDTVYKANSCYDAAWRLDNGRWRSVDEDDAFAARAMQAYAAREPYASSIETWEVEGPAMVAAANEQFLLIADAPSGDGTSVASATAAMVAAARSATGSSAPEVMVATRMGTFAYDVVSDSFGHPERGNGSYGQLHTFVREALSLLEV